MQSWNSVVVNDDTLADHGRAGVVKSAGPYLPEGAKPGAEVVDVQLDGDTELTVFEVGSLKAL